MSESNKPARCPFCGEEPSAAGALDSWFIRCDSPFCQVAPRTLTCLSVAGAVSIWNTRPTTAALEAELAKVKSERDDFQAGAKVEADAGDDARAELARVNVKNGALELSNGMLSLREEQALKEKHAFQSIAERLIVGTREGDDELFLAAQCEFDRLQALHP
jgi:hypothetical protein